MTKRKRPRSRSSLMTRPEFCANGKHVMAATTKMDGAAKPMTIDLIWTKGENEGRVALGILKIEDGLLTICLGPAGKARPREFSSEPGSRQPARDVRASEEHRTAEGSLIGKAGPTATEPTQAPSLADVATLASSGLQGRTAQ